jgi:hypothetical protein
MAYHSLAEKSFSRMCSSTFFVVDAKAVQEIWVIELYNFSFTLIYQMEVKNGPCYLPPRRPLHVLMRREA